MWNYIICNPRVLERVRLLFVYCDLLGIHAPIGRTCPSICVPCGESTVNLKQMMCTLSNIIPVEVYDFLVINR